MTRCARGATTVLAGLLAGAVVAGCGSSSTEDRGLVTGSGPVNASITGMLRLVPAGTTTATVDLYRQAATAAGIAALPANPSTDAVSRYYGDLAEKAGVPGSELTQQLGDPAPGFSAAGVTAGDIQADVAAGDPPNNVLMAFGHFDSGTIDNAARTDRTWSSALTTARMDGTTVYRWLNDDNADLSRGPAGVLSEMPSSRRLAVPNASTLLLSRNDKTMQSLLDTATGRAGSPASDPTAVAVAAVLDRQHVYAATVTTKQPSMDQVLGGNGDPARAQALRGRLAGQLLRPYRMAGIGVTRQNGAATMVIVLANQDAATAQANATALRTAVTRGISARTDEKWSGRLRPGNVGTDGNLTVATFTELTNPALWSEIIEQNDTLLAHS